MGGFLGALGPLLGAGESIFGAIQGQNAQNWYKGGLVNILNTLNQLNQFGLGRALESSNPLQSAATDLVNKGNQFSFGTPDGYPGALTSLQDALMSASGGLNPAFFQQASQGGMTPGMAGSMAGMQGVANGLNDPMAALQSILGGGGRTVDSGTLAQRLMEFGTGQGSPLDTLQNVGGEMLGARGQTGFNQSLMDRAGEVVNGGGHDPSLDALNGLLFNIAAQNGGTPGTQSGLAKALQILSQGGMTGGMNSMLNAGLNTINQAPLGVAGLTPTGASGEQTALNALQTGGATPFTNFFQSRGAQLAGKDAVLPMQEALGMARDEAANQVLQASKRAHEQAANRGGGPGAVVANGLQNQDLADFADEGAKTIAQAVQQQALAQQQLGLQQQAEGAQMGLQGGGLEAQRLGTAGGLLSQLEGIATNRFGVGGGLAGQAQQLGLENQGQGFGALQGLSGLETQRLMSALGMVPQVDQSMLNRVNTYGSLGLGGAQDQNARMGLGGNLDQMYNQDRLGGMNSLQSLLGMENQNALGAGQLMGSMSGTQGNLLNDILGGQLNAGNLGLNQGNSYYQSLMSLLGQRGNVAGMGLNLMNMGMDPLKALTQNWTGFAANNSGGALNVFNPASANSPMGNFLMQNAPNVTNSLSGAYTSMFPGQTNLPLPGPGPANGIGFNPMWYPTSNMNTLP